LLWIQEFQEHLQDLKNGTATNSSYTIDEASYGIEWLFNYTYSTNANGLSIGGTKTNFNIPENNDWLTLYKQIESAVSGEISSQSDLDFNFLTLEIIDIDNEPKIQLHTKFKLNNEDISSYFSSSENQSFSCDDPPFLEQELFLGLGGEDGDVLFPCNPDFGFCGGQAACEIPDLFALETIEAFHNFEINNQFICKGDNERISFSNPITFGIRGTEVSSLLNNCDPSIPQEESRPGPCDCLSTDILNCLYCETDNFISNLDLNNINPPQGTELINIEIFTLAFDYSSNANPYYFLELTFAEVECVPDITTDQPPILIEIICC